MKLKAFSLMMLVLLPATNIVAAKNKREGHTLGHYIVHSVVQSMAGTAIVGGSVLGTAIGGGITLSAQDPLVAMAGIATVIGSIGGGTYSMYSLPQWTDSYVLGYETERNAKQNVICFCSKLFLWPGILLGEFISHLDGIEPEPQ